MLVLKRNGKLEKLSVDKITSRIKEMSWGLTMFYDIDDVVVEMHSKLYTNIKTTDIDILLCDTLSNKNNIHPDYKTLAGRIEVSNLHKETEKQFSKVIEIIYNSNNSVISEELYQIIQEHKQEIDSVIVYNRDFLYDHLKIKELIKTHLIYINGKIIERPQHMLMRTSIERCGNNIDSIIETYNTISQL